MELKGSKTEKNLLEAFAGESMARNKYTYFASKAKKDGFVQISKIFEETAANEKEHAKMWYKYLNGGSVSDTAANLKDAAEGENDELVLTDIDFTYLTRNEDGITAIRFNQAAVQASAEKAVADAGYTGSYVIRFTFVPKYAEDTLDYAITFDDLIV